MADGPLAPPPIAPAQPAPVQAVAVTSAALTTKVKPTVALRTAWKTTLVAGIGALLSALLLILGYLANVNLIALGITPERAALAGLVINVVLLLLRAYGVKPIVLEDRRGDDRHEGDWRDGDRR